MLKPSSIEFGRDYSIVLVVAIVAAFPLAFYVVFMLVEAAWLSIWGEGLPAGMWVFAWLGIGSILLAFVGAATFRSPWLVASMFLASFAALSPTFYPWNRAGPEPTWTAWFAAGLFGLGAAWTFVACRIVANNNQQAIDARRG